MRTQLLALSMLLPAPALFAADRGPETRSLDAAAGSAPLSLAESLPERLRAHVVRLAGEIGERNVWEPRAQPPPGVGGVQGGTPV